MTVVYQNERWEVKTCERESHLIDLKISGIRHTITLEKDGRQKQVNVCEVLFDYEN